LKLSHSTVLPREAEMIACPGNSCLTEPSDPPTVAPLSLSRGVLVIIPNNIVMLSGMNQLSEIVGDTNHWLPQNKLSWSYFYKIVSAVQPETSFYCKSLSSLFRRVASKHGRQQHRLSLRFLLNKLADATPVRRNISSALQDTPNLFQDKFWPDIWHSWPYQLEDTAASSFLLC
jgi:hypothetical protein